MFRRLALLLVVVALAGCNNEKNRNLIDSRVDQVSEIAKQAQVPAPKETFDPLTVSDRVWSGNKSVRLSRGVPLPAKYEIPRGVTLISGAPLTLSEIVHAVTTQTGMPIVLGDGIASDDEGDEEEGKRIPLAYEGTLSGLLNVLASNYGVNWRYDGVSLKLFRFETRVFVIEALPGEQTIKDGMKEDSASSSGSSSTGEGGSYSASSTNTLQQSSEMSVEFKVWDELNQVLNSIIAGKGTVVLSPSTGTATVRTTPEKMDIVAKYIQEENKRLSQQIAVNVEVYSVTLADGDNYDVAFNTALQSLSNAFKANVSSLTGPSASVAGMGSLSLAIFNAKNGGEVNPVFKALSTVGDATRVTQFPMVTLNNRTVSRRVGTDQTYVASLSNSDSVDSTFSSSTVEPGTIREGFSLQVTPRVLQDGRIMMQYSFSLVDVIELRSLDTGAGTVELPETSSRVFVQQAMLNSGSTLIIGGHDDEKVSQSSHGTGSPFNYFLGGGSRNSKDRVMMFIAITPQVIDIRKTEQF